ncbi:MAG: ribonuclease HI family protein [Candidatus Bipolaricaulota bacterium]|nr:MAG: ribonuclease HI family protein [Candidatus Bipolaricaulota bacterium]
MDKLFVYVDGTARGEPGDAAIGIVITDTEGNVVQEASRLIGRSTSLVAEYRALIEGCRLAHGHGPDSVIVFTDNQQLANHINGVFDTRRPNLRHLVEEAKSILNGFPEWRVNYIDRAANRRAPRLVERAYHHRIQEQVARERLQAVILSRTASLSEDDLQRVVDFVDDLSTEE